VIAPRRRSKADNETVTILNEPADTLTTPWATPVDELARQLGSGPQGLTTDAAAAALPATQARAVASRARSSVWQLLARQFASPIVLILITATLISGVLGDWLDASIILTIVVLSGLLNFAQERGRPAVDGQAAGHDPAGGQRAARWAARRGSIR